MSFLRTNIFTESFSDLYTWKMFLSWLRFLCTFNWERIDPSHAITHYCLHLSYLLEKPFNMSNYIFHMFLLPTLCLIVPYKHTHMWYVWYIYAYVYVCIKWIPHLHPAIWNAIWVVLLMFLLWCSSFFVHGFLHSPVYLIRQVTC